MFIVIEHFYEGDQSFEIGQDLSITRYVRNAIASHS